MSKNRQYGFTLIEISIVTIIIGLLSAGALEAYNVIETEKRIAVTDKNIETVKAAILAYQNHTGYYPCPATRAAKPDSKDYAVSTVCGSFSNDEALVSAASRVSIGAVPGRTLGLPDNVLVDGWEHQLEYAVTNSLTQEGTFKNGEGAIFVRDINGNDIPAAANKGSNQFVIVSHGADGVGAWNYGGERYKPCVTKGKDVSNCNGHIIFVYSRKIYTPAGPNHYDDIVAFKNALDEKSCTVRSGPIGPLTKISPSITQSIS